ncbi:NepR family anti-sigma factor [Hoeflea olei]|uniref:NepR family anti-sigma factor n=1 Tax=Hoeflea olei TaxID=1480615 RepID=UPI0014960639|nr:NepR family anti-sigma factor [Hoeflea olei]
MSKRSSKHDASDAIGSQLRRYYQSVEQEPIPGQLLDLLEKLDEAERSGGSSGGH